MPINDGEIAVTFCYIAVHQDMAGIFKHLHCPRDSTVYHLIMWVTFKLLESSFLAQETCSRATDSRAPSHPITTGFQSCPHITATTLTPCLKACFKWVFWVSEFYFYSLRNALKGFHADRRWWPWLLVLQSRENRKQECIPPLDTAGTCWVCYNPSSHIHTFPQNQSNAALNISKWW